MLGQEDNGVNVAIVVGLFLLVLWKALFPERPGDLSVARSLTSYSAGCSHSWLTIDGVLLPAFQPHGAAREPFGPVLDYTAGTIVSQIDPKSTDDELLAIRCQLGEPAAFDDLITRWHGPLWAFVRRLSGDDDASREILQDVWLRVIRGIPRLRDGSKLRAWLFGIARRTLMDRLRDQFARSSPVDIDVDEIPTESSVDEIDGLAALEHALELPLVEREAITLFYLQELSLNEIAEALEVPVGTVKSRLFRGRRLLRQHMTE